ncbi:MAG: hypothetical protein ACXWTW_02395, partial [Methylobacter sp.]
VALIPAWIHVKDNVIPAGSAGIQATGMGASPPWLLGSGSPCRNDATRRNLTAGWRRNKACLKSSFIFD